MKLKIAVLTFAAAVLLAGCSSVSFLDECTLCKPAEKGDLAEVNRLLADGANPNTKGKLTGFTALHWAAGDGNAEVVKTLLVAGADPNAKNINRYTPLHWAAGFGHAQVVKILLVAGADPSAVARVGTDPVLTSSGDLKWRTNTVLDSALDAGRAEVVGVLLMAFDSREADLHLAIYHGNAKDVKALLAAGANPNAWINGSTAWLFADSLWSKAETGENAKAYREIIRILEESGAVK